MNDTLNRIPCGYLSLLDDNKISVVNQTLLDLLGYDYNALRGLSIDSILSNSSRIFFRIYFTPLILLNTKVNEMFLTLMSSSGEEIPVLLNAVRLEMDGSVRHECVVFPIHRQMEYEQQISRSEAAANKARNQLQLLQSALEDKQRSLSILKEQIEIYTNQMEEMKVKLDKG
ncbi:PAS domain-containing protein [Paenibacillus wynnii]|uniref:PAS domain-containing protein n=1 Tax=Paenibacillus wynnii TaxID=268407 RepID=UPI002795116A|nr:PAS domain-containing protein [Paenibacillus wynnii]MDQ0196535.1 sigma-B regulation protein RsbU (phosphoserine phosphatase) [Paenibacillus wynnii]